MTELETPGIGEAAEVGRRKAFWNSLAVIILGGLVIGGMFGFYMAVSRHHPKVDGLLAAMPDGLLIGLCVAAFVAFALGCWKFYQAIDEVELVDNLWASTAAYYIYATAFPLWWVLAEKKLVPEVSGWTLYFTALFAGTIAYGWRKWRAR